MNRSWMMATAAMTALLIGFTEQASAENVETVVVTAEKLNAARVGIQSQVGASTYTITDANIEAQPGGDNNLLNQVVLQAPGVAQELVRSAACSRRA